jgi:hypothetical protein
MSLAASVRVPDRLYLGSERVRVCVAGEFRRSLLQRSACQGHGGFGGDEDLRKVAAPD